MKESTFVEDAREGFLEEALKDQLLRKSNIQYLYNIFIFEASFLSDR